MGNGIRIGSIAGIAIHLDWSLAIVFFLIANALALGLFPAWHPDWPPLLAWGTALAAAALFFVSVLLHELAHALVGRARGMTIRRITLFIFGGMAHLEREPHGWRAELAMAIVGPLTSLAIGLAALAASAALVGPLELDPEHPERLLAALSAPATLLLWLGQVNLVLAAFNLVPAFPLDGGRVLRALLWGASGDLRRATRWASSAGQGFAWFLIAVGLAMAAGIRVPVFGVGLVSGLWLMFIGWFLNNAALASYRQVLVRDALENVPVARLMRRALAAVPPGLAVSDFVAGYLLASDQRAFPVEDGGRLVGMVTLADVRRVPRERWDETAVAAIMTPADALASVAPGDDALEALSLLAARNVNQLPVIADGRLQGLILREDILKWLALYGDQQLGGPAPPRR
ncbi:MAG: site-2 protease family protein [Burkholderiales bacterium]|nr:site-2 protease family protein [Burkholderiales bacterium]